MMNDCQTLCRMKVLLLFPPHICIQVIQCAMNPSHELRRVIRGQQSPSECSSAPIFLMSFDLEEMYIVWLLDHIFQGLLISSPSLICLLRPQSLVWGSAAGWINPLPFDYWRIGGRDIYSAYWHLFHTFPDVWTSTMPGWTWMTASSTAAAELYTIGKYLAQIFLGQLSSLHL